MGSALSVAGFAATAVSDFGGSQRYAQNAARPGRTARRIYCATHCERPHFHSATHGQDRSAGQHVSRRARTTIQSGDAFGLRVDHEHRSSQTSALGCRSTSQAWSAIRQAGGIGQGARSEGWGRFCAGPRRRSPDRRSQRSLARMGQLACSMGVSDRPMLRPLRLR